MAKKDPLYVTWRKRTKDGRLVEVDIFEFIAHELGRTTYEWNTLGLGAIHFLKGTLKIRGFDDHSPVGKGTYQALWYELDLKKLQESTYKTTDFTAGLEVLFKILSDKTELLKLEKKAYAYMVKLLTDYLGGLNALVMASGYQSAAYEPPKGSKRLTGKALAKRAKWFSGSKNRGMYSSKWEQLVNQIILKKDPKVIGSAVVSFSLADLLQIQLPSNNSPLKSIFMMEEFGTGMYADPDLRRPYLGASTPYKVPQEIANQWHTPDAIYMWWPFFTFIQKAWFMRLNKIKTQRTKTRWIDKLRTTHGVKTSLNDYREKAFADLKKYKAQGSLTNPLAWAFGGKRGGVGHPGRQARHLFYDRGGIVQSIRIIQEAGYKRLLQLVDAEIEKVIGKASGFSVADTVFTRPLNLV